MSLKSIREDIEKKLKPLEMELKIIQADPSIHGQIRVGSAIALLKAKLSHQDLIEKEILKEIIAEPIAERIMTEFNKHPTLDWARLAEIKIVSNLKQRLVGNK